jgi:hypothetical protein
MDLPIYRIGLKSQRLRFMVCQLPVVTDETEEICQSWVVWFMFHCCVSALHCVERRAWSVERRDRERLKRTKRLKRLAWAGLCGLCFTAVSLLLIAWSVGHGASSVETGSD